MRAAESLPSRDVSPRAWLLSNLNVETLQHQKLLHEGAVQGFPPRGPLSGQGWGRAHLQAAGGQVNPCVCAHVCVCVCLHACLFADTHRAASLWMGMGSCSGCEGPGLSGAGLTSQRSQGTALGDLRGTQTLGGAVAGCLLQCRSWAGNGLGLRNLQFFIYVTEMRGQRHLLSVVISVGPPVLEW